MNWNKQRGLTIARRAAKTLLLTLACLLLAGGILWATASLWYDVTRLRWLAGLLAISFAAGCAALLLLVRPFWRALLATWGLVLLVIVAWNLIPPRNDRDWTPDVARLAQATIAGNRLTIQNVRNFDYRSETEFTEQWETRSYDLSQLRGVDLFICFWGPTLIAHTIVSWEFADGPPLAISIETRKEQGETYSALRGFFRQYELYYVVADERDVIRLRTNFRGERAYLYHLRIRPEAARDVLLDYLKEVNALAQHPCWYNALIQNCTTTIRHHALHVGAGKPWDWRILVNGHIDEMGYERGTIDNRLPFPEMKKRSEITEHARAAGDAPGFSTRIREGLPDRPDFTSDPRKK